MTKISFTSHLSISPRRTYLWFQDPLTVIVVLIWMVNPGITRWAMNSFKGQSACQLHNFTITTYEIRRHKAVIIHPIIHQPGNVYFGLCLSHPPVLDCLLSSWSEQLSDSPHCWSKFGKPIRENWAIFSNTFAKNLSKY